MNQRNIPNSRELQVLELHRRFGVPRQRALLLAEHHWGARS